MLQAGVTFSRSQIRCYVTIYALYVIYVMYSKSKAKARKNEEIELQNKANELRLKAERNPADKRILNELFATNLRLEKLLQYKTKGAILRSKVRWFEQGERNTKYFLNLEKRNFCQKSVTKLKLKDDTYTYDQFDILQAEKAVLRIALHVKERRCWKICAFSFL